MSTLNWLMLAIGLLLVAADILRRMFLSDPQKTTSAVHLVPAIAFIAPFSAILLAFLSGLVFESDGTFDGRRYSDSLLFLGFIMSLVASATGIFTLMVLSVQGFMEQGCWRRGAVCRILVLACLDVVHPVLLLGFALALVLLKRTMFG